MNDSHGTVGRIVLAGLLLAGLVSVAHAGEVEDALADCAAIPGSFKRLDCYDALARQQKPAASPAGAPPAGQWKVEEHTSSGISGGTDVFMVVQAIENIPGENGEVRPVLVVRCQDLNTAVIFNFGRFIEQSRAEAALRIDDGAVMGVSLKMSASGKAFGYWQGEEAIPFVKRLLGGKRLLVQVTPFGANPVLAEFPVEGINEAVAPLRKACGW